MKKMMLLELAIFVLILAVAVIAMFTLTRPVMAPDPSEDIPGESTTEPSGSGEASPSESAEGTTGFVPTWKTYPADRKLLAQQYFVYDCNGNEFLTISGKTDEKVYPASITKLFTAYVALQYLQPDTKITAGGALDMVAWGSSVAKIEEGDVLTVEQLVEAMMLPSGNDAAYILSVAAGRVIEKDDDISASYANEVFMEEMNDQLESLGMTGTHFVNPDGIHETDHYSTFADLAVLGKLAMKNETIMKYAKVATETVTLHGTEIKWKNTNAIINPASPYYCPYATGLKTGQTPSAGSCLLSSFQMDEHSLLIGVFGCPEENDRFDDTLQLFNNVVLNEK